MSPLIWASCLFRINNLHPSVIQGLSPVWRVTTLDGTSTSPNRRERPLIIRNGDRVSQKVRETDGQKVRERGREDAVLYEKGGWKADRCRKCWNYRRKMLPSELTNTIEQFIVYVNFTYIKVFEADNIYKKKLPKCNFTYIFFAIFISLWGSTHDSVDCWSAHRSPAACNSSKRVHDWCKDGWRRPGAHPHKQKSWLRRWV